jgi:hypothetical protein
MMIFSLTSSMATQKIYPAFLEREAFESFIVIAVKPGQSKRVLMRASVKIAI